MTRRIKGPRELKVVDRNVSDYCTRLLWCYCIKFNVLFKLYLSADTVISLYITRDNFTLGALKTHHYIGNIVIIYYWRSLYCRARNNGRSTDNVRTDCGFDWSNFRLAGLVDRSKFNRIENEINLRFLLFSCYLSNRCLLRNFDKKSWWHATRAVIYNSRIETDIGIKHIFISPLYFTFIVKHFKVL